MAIIKDLCQVMSDDVQGNYITRLCNTSPFWEKEAGTEEGGDPMQYLSCEINGGVVPDLWEDKTWVPEGTEVRVTFRCMASDPNDQCVGTECTPNYSGQSWQMMFQGDRATDSSINPADYRTGWIAQCTGSYGELSYGKNSDDARYIANQEYEVGLQTMITATDA